MFRGQATGVKGARVVALVGNGLHDVGSVLVLSQHDKRNCRFVLQHEATGEFSGPQI